MNFDARKQVLCSKTFWGNEIIDSWRLVFVELKNRGLTRMLLLVTDDFSGLKNLVDGLGPHKVQQGVLVATNQRSKGILRAGRDLAHERDIRVVKRAGLFGV